MVTPNSLPAAHVGLNADWNCRAWVLRGGNGHNASVFIVDNEDGTFSLVQRFWSFEQATTTVECSCRIDGKPTAECWGVFDGNDHIAFLIRGLAESEAAMLLFRGSSSK